MPVFSNSLDVHIEVDDEADADEAYNELIAQIRRNVDVVYVESVSFPECIEDCDESEEG